MWPFSRGSDQPIRRTPEFKPCHKSQSAPQVNVAPLQQQIPKELAAQNALRKPLPPRSLKPLLSEFQLTTLSQLPIHEALALLVDSISESVPVPHTDSISLLLYSVYRWAQSQHFHTNQISALLAIYKDAAMFCLHCPCRTQQEMYQFFKESLLTSSVEWPPNSTYIFRPDQCKAILLSFCHRFLLVLPLFRLTSLPNLRFTLTWNPPDESEISNQFNG